MTVVIAPPLCTACGACLITCPEHALLPAPLYPGVLDARCTDCFACIEICPTGAISSASSPIEPVTSDNLNNLVL